MADERQSAIRYDRDDASEALGSKVDFCVHFNGPVDVSFNGTDHNQYSNQHYTDDTV